MDPCWCRIRRKRVSCYKCRGNNIDSCSAASARHGYSEYSLVYTTTDVARDASNHQPVANVESGGRVADDAIAYVAHDVAAYDAVAYDAAAHDAATHDDGLAYDGPAYDVAGSQR